MSATVLTIRLVVKQPAAFTINVRQNLSGYKVVNGIEPEFTLTKALFPDRIATTRTKMPDGSQDRIHLHQRL